jgi:hypothetical protein
MAEVARDMHAGAYILERLANGRGFASHFRHAKAQGCKFSQFVPKKLPYPSVSYAAEEIVAVAVLSEKSSLIIQH